MSGDSYDTLTGLPLASQEFTTAILGPPILGWMLNLMTYGIVLSYFLQYLNTRLWRNDTTKLKALVLIVMLLATFQTSLAFTSIFHYSTSQRRDYTTLWSQTVTDSFLTLPVGVEGALVQGFLALRAQSLLKNRWLKAVYFALVGAAITCGLVGACLYVVCSTFARAGKLDQILPLNYSIAIGMWLWGCLFVDLCCTISLVILLRKRIFGFATTDNIIKRLITLSLHTASYTAICALLGCITAYAIDTSSLYSNVTGVFWQPLSSFYALSLLITLASREKMRDLASATRPLNEVSSTLSPTILAALSRAPHTRSMTERGGPPGPSGDPSRVNVCLQHPHLASMGDVEAQKPHREGSEGTDKSNRLTRVSMV